jgi:hypothetical protein
VRVEGDRPNRGEDFADHGVDRMVKVGQTDAGGARLSFRLGPDVVVLPGGAFPGDDAEHGVGGALDPGASQFGSLTLAAAAARADAQRPGQVAAELGFAA